MTACFRTISTFHAAQCDGAAHARCLDESSKRNWPGFPILGGHVLSVRLFACQHDCNSKHCDLQAHTGNVTCRCSFLDELEQLCSVTVLLIYLVSHPHTHAQIHNTHSIFTQQPQGMDRLLADMFSLVVSSPKEVTYNRGDKPNHCVCNKHDSRKRHDCKVFGIFRCSNCGTTWRSGSAWYSFKRRTLLKQDCRRCGTANEPEQFHRLQIRADFGVDDGRAPHMSDKCEKCKALGYNCTRS